MNKAKGVATALAFVLAVISATAAAAAETDITGAWIVTLDLVTGKASVEANIKQTDDKLAAQVMTPAGAIDFNGTLVNNKISAVYSMQLQGNFLEIRMNGVVDADTLSGTIEFAPGQEVKWTAVRKPVGVVSDPAGAPTSQDSTAEPAHEVPK
jgi:hypothetical protein